MIRKITLALLFAAFTFKSQAQTVLFTENFSGGIPATWTIFNEDGLTPNAAVSEFTSGWIQKIADTDTSAASTSYYEPVGSANDYLITPQLMIGNFSKLVWSARSLDASHPDGYQVLISTTDSLVTSFTDTLMTVTEEFPYWKSRSVQLDLEGYANQSIYIAFQNNTTDGFVLLLDDVTLLGAETASLPSTTRQENALQLYPNPTSDQLTLTISTEEFVIAKIFSLDGQLISTENQTSFSVNHLTNGMYYVQVETKNGQQIIPFQKQ